MRLVLWAPFFLAGCVAPRSPEDPSEWFDTGSLDSVEEPLRFTEENYNYDGNIARLNSRVFPVPDGITVFGSNDLFENNSACDAQADTDLPMQIEGIVTILPRLYMKSDGCGGNGDEKYYGNFFIQDQSGATFVLGDTKTNHFVAGNKVSLLVRAARTVYDFNEVYSWDLVSVDRTVYPIYYETKFGPVDTGDLYKVMRVTGDVTTLPDTFGSFTVEADDGSDYAVQLDVDLNRRGYSYPVGTRMQVTGPILFSYSTYSIAVMSVGQITVL